jgi:general secretion pathway protein G
MTRLPHSLSVAPPAVTTTHAEATALALAVDQLAVRGPTAKGRRPGWANTQRRRGFTLIELMVVLVIIGVLAALIVPNVLERADDARATAAKTDVNNLMQALKLYRLDNQRYPSAEQGLQALITKPSTGPIPPNWKPYLDKLPNDPWGRPYQFLNPGIKGEIDVMSFGADGKPGGEGKDADVGSWQ